MSVGDEDDVDDPELADVDMAYRGRGRPRLDPLLRRREKLVISLTADEMRKIMLAAAHNEPDPLTPNEWARRHLLRLADESDSKRKEDRK